MPDEIAGALRVAIERGEWAPVRDRMAADAVLRTSNEAGRRRIDGADAVVAHLAKPGPGEVRAWAAEEWPSGVALTFEWAGATATDRRRWYVRTASDGRIAELWSAAARPSGEPAAPAQAPPPKLLARLATTGVAPLSHGGNSGAALLRATRDDGTAFILKRVTPGADWLARATRDDGRTARLHAAGAFDSMPPTIEHAIVDVEHSDHGAWVAMRDVHAQLLPDDARLTRAQSRRVLDAAAALHTAFQGSAPDGAARLRDRLGMSSPAVAGAERASSDLLPKQFEHGWEAFAELVPGD